MDCIETNTSFFWQLTVNKLGCKLAEAAHMVMARYIRTFRRTNLSRIFLALLQPFFIFYLLLYLPSNEFHPIKAGRAVFRIMFAAFVGRLLLDFIDSGSLNIWVNLVYVELESAILECLNHQRSNSRSRGRILT